MAEGGSPNTDAAGVGSGSNEEDDKEVPVMRGDDTANLTAPSISCQDPCFRCQTRVYPVEKVDVGVLFHRRCFRCRDCRLQLSLRTFHWSPGRVQDIYCAVHLPKLVGTIDEQAMGIRSALNAPRRAGMPNEQVNHFHYPRRIVTENLGQLGAVMHDAVW